MSATYNLFEPKVVIEVLEKTCVYPPALNDTGRQIVAGEEVGVRGDVAQVVICSWDRPCRWWLLAVWDLGRDDPRHKIRLIRLILVTDVKSFGFHPICGVPSHLPLWI